MSYPTNGALSTQKGRFLCVYKATDPWKHFKEIVALTDQETGISGIQRNDNKGTSYYTLDGKQIESPHKGMNIVRTSNGKTKKIIVK